MVKLFANSGDPDQTPRSVASDLGLHCQLPFYGSPDYNGLKELGSFSNILCKGDSRFIHKRSKLLYWSDVHLKRAGKIFLSFFVPVYLNISTFFILQHFDSDTRSIVTCFLTLLRLDQAPRSGPEL